MAIYASQIQFRNGSGAILVNGKLNNLFPNGDVNAGTSYRALEVRNTNASLTLSSVKAWLTLDARGGSFAIAYDATSGVIAADESWSDVDEAALTYSAPTSKATGITLANLAPATKLRLYCRRILSGATAVSPENNRVWVGGTSPM